MNGRPLIELLAVSEALDVLDDAIEANEPSHVFAMFSGGHDSLASTAITARHPSFSAAVHINTGIGIEETREFVRSTCEEQGWPLIELHAEGDNRYEQLVERFGFPGPAGHGVMYRRLKERQVRRLVREHKVGADDRIILATGMRAEESVRRMRHAELAAGARGWGRDGAQVWTSPIARWSKADVNRFLEGQGLRRNRVSDLIHMSGECLCGSYAKPGEMEDLETWFPEVAAYLHRLERRVEAAGKIACVWGHRPDDVHNDQLRLMPILPLCTSCEARA